MQDFVPPGGYIFYEIDMLTCDYWIIFLCHTYLGNKTVLRSIFSIHLSSNSKNPTKGMQNHQGRTQTIETYKEHYDIKMSPSQEMRVRCSSGPWRYTSPLKL